jgi:hypothetical protein
MSEISKLPWRVKKFKYHNALVNANGNVVLRASCDRNAENYLKFIARAVNCHDALVKACEAADAYDRTLLNGTASTEEKVRAYEHWSATNMEALAKVKERQP